MSDITTRANEWIVCHDTGVSSKAIWSVMMGVASAKTSYPSDPSDFGRCYRLLQKIPEWRARIGEMAGVSPYWKALVERWDEIEALYTEEKSQPITSKTYALMKSILRQIEDRDKNFVRLGEGMSMRLGE